MTAASTFDSTDVSAGALDGLSVVLAALRQRGSTATIEVIVASVENAGASVHVVSTMTEARRCTALRGPCAAVVVCSTDVVVSRSIHADLRALGEQRAALVVSVDATTEQRIDLLNSGADNVLTSVHPDEVIAALVAVLRRSRPSIATAEPPVLSAGEICVHLPSRTATADGRTLVLSPLEFDLLAYLVAHAGEALSRDRLLRNVWGYEIGGRDTVTVHIRRLRRKIEADPSRPTLLKTVWGTGYRLDRAATAHIPTDAAVADA